MKMMKNRQKLTNKTHTITSQSKIMWGVMIIFIGLLCVNSVSAWNVTSAIYSQSFSLASQDDPYSISFGSSGIKMYMAGTKVDSRVYEYNLSSAWSVTSATYSQNASISQAISPLGLFFKPDGTKMYASDPSTGVHEYNLSSVWSVTSAVYSQKFITNKAGVFLKPDGTKMYLVGYYDTIIHQYSLNPAWSVQTASSDSKTLDTTDQCSAPRGIFFKSDGTKVFVSCLDERVYEYDLLTAWDISTDTYLQNFSVADRELEPVGLYLTSSKLYVSGYAGKNITEYNLSSPPDVSNIIINLTSPEDMGIIQVVAGNFTANYSAANYNFTNVTYYLWNSTGVFNNSVVVDITGTSNSTTFQFFDFDSGNYKWNVLGCGTNATGALCEWSDSNYTFSATLFSGTSTTYNTTVFETSNQYLDINISTDPTINSVSGRLWYNGTRYTSTVVEGASGVYQAYNNIDITLTSATNNKTFLWEFIFVLDSGATSLQNSSTYSHQVNKTFFEHCSNYTTRFINFTTYEAENPYPDLNASFKISWDSWLGNGAVKRSGSWENVSELNHTFPFCIYPPDRTFNVNAQIEFEASGYSQNYHYLDDAELTNITTDIQLYLLNDSDATLTVLKVQDEAQNAIENVTIQIQLYDVGTDTFYTVGMAKTAFNGEDLVYLNWYDSLYKFVLTQNGNVIKQTTPYKITKTPQIFEIISTITFPYDKFRDFVYSLIFNDVTNNFVLTFTKPSGTVDAGCLRVIKRNPTNDTVICNVCETSSSATLYCNIAAYGNGTYYATFYATGSLFRVETIYKIIGAVDEIYDLIGNIDGTIYAFLFVGVVLAMFLIHPIFAVVGIMLGVLGAIIIGFQPLYITEVVGIILVGGFVIWLIKR